MENMLSHCPNVAAHSEVFAQLDAHIEAWMVPLVDAIYSGLPSEEDALFLADMEKAISAGPLLEFIRVPFLLDVLSRALSRLERMPEANTGKALKALQGTISVLLAMDSEKSVAGAVHAADDGAITSVMETVWEAWATWANFAAASASFTQAASETAAAKTMASVAARTTEWRAQRDYLLLLVRSAGLH